MEAWVQEADEDATVGNLIKVLEAERLKGSSSTS